MCDFTARYSDVAPGHMHPRLPELLILPQLAVPALPGATRTR